MIEEYVLPDHQNDRFYERFSEQRTRDLNNLSTTEEHDPFPCPIEPLQSSSSKSQGKRLCTHSSDSGVNSPVVLSRLPALSPATPIEISTSHPFTSQPVHRAQQLPREPLSPIQQFNRNNAKLRSKEPKHISLTAG